MVTGGIFIYRLKLTARNSGIIGRIKSMWKLRQVLSAFVLGGALLVSACSSEDDELAYVERPPEDLYNEALDQLQSENYIKSIQLFDEVERQHPYSVWARQAILMSAFAAYEDSEYIKSIASSERFLQLYPGSEDAPYALYLIGQSYYEQISDVQRDQSFTQQALRNLRELIRRYPQSSYAKDARIKIDLAVDHLAGKEMDVGRFYLRKGAYTGAINRFRNVIETYQTTSHVPEALHRLVEAYLSLGIQSEAQTAAAVLGHNYPGSSWYADSYFLLEGEDLRPIVDERSWLASLWGSVF